MPRVLISMRTIMEQFRGEWNCGQPLLCSPTKDKRKTSSQSNNLGFGVWKILIRKPVQGKLRYSPLCKFKFDFLFRIVCHREQLFKKYPVFLGRAHIAFDQLPPLCQGSTWGVKHCFCVAESDDDPWCENKTLMFSVEIISILHCFVMIATFVLWFLLVTRCFAFWTFFYSRIICWLFKEWKNTSFNKGAVPRSTPFLPFFIYEYLLWLNSV